MATTTAPTGSAYRFNDESGGVIFAEGARFTVCSMTGACVVNVVNQMLRQKLVSSKVWEDRLRDSFGVTVVDGGGPPTCFEPAAHPARAVCFGDQIVVMIHPTGRIVAHGGARCTEKLILDALQRGVRLVKLCCESEVTMTSTFRLDTLIVRVTDTPELLRGLADPLFLDKLAARYPTSCSYAPDLCPALFIRIPDASGSSTGVSPVMTITHDGACIISNAITAAQIVHIYGQVKNRLILPHLNATARAATADAERVAAGLKRRRSDTLDVDDEIAAAAAAAAQS